MAKNPLITAWEVVKYSPVQKEFPLAQICTQIRAKEYSIFCECYLGLEFYKELCNDVIPVEGAEEFDSGKIYNKGDKIVFYDCVLQSKLPQNSVDPCDSVAAQWWEEVPKFKTECYNDLWECFLRNYLAYCILASVLWYTTYKAGNKGLTKYSENFRGESTGLITVDRADIHEYKKSLQRDAQSILENMMTWIKLKHEECTDECTNKEDLTCDCNFLLIEWVANKCGSNCPDPKANRQRNFRFKN